MRLMTYDTSEWAGLVADSWPIGGKIYKVFRSIDTYKGTDSWDRAMRWITTVSPGEKIDVLQFWCHGSPGKVWFNGRALSLDSLKPDSSMYEDLVRLRARLTPDSLIWFRTCSTFQGEVGHKFAEAFSRFMGCRVAAYTFTIGPFQSGLHSISPGQDAYWPTNEGVGLVSGPFQPNTIFMLRGEVPKGW